MSMGFLGCVKRALSVAILALPVASHAVTIRVPSQQPTIRAGIQAASYGDTVLVACGTYYEHGIPLRSGVRVVSEGGAEPCAVVDAQRLGRVFICTNADNTTLLRGFTITGGLASANGDGGGLLSQSCALTIEDCLVVSNEATHYGGGIATQSSVNTAPTIRRVVFQGNVAPRGGGLHCYWVGSPVIEHVEFRENVASFSGGGIFFDQDIAPILTDVLFVGNRARYGGGAGCDDSSDPVFDGAEFRDNVAESYGGAIAFWQSSRPLIKHALLVGNHAGIGGGALWTEYIARPELHNVTAVQNDAPLGSALYCGGGLPRIYNTILAFGTGGAAVVCPGSGSDPLLWCSDVFGNAGGDWVGPIASQQGVEGNISSDPLFCGDLAPDDPWSLEAGSPCAAAANPVCGIVGAFDVSCGYSPVWGTSWTAIKAMYRGPSGRPPN
jgi:predicted outer membrane repeat protein